jgi:hypothetical protein
VHFEQKLSLAFLQVMVAVTAHPLIFGHTITMSAVACALEKKYVP